MKQWLKQAVQFIGLSGLGWLLDTAVYLALGLVSSHLALNNCISSWVGFSFVFAFSTRYVFQSHSRLSLRWKYVLYFLYQMILIGSVSQLLAHVYPMIYSCLTQLHLSALSSLAAKIIVTPITMLMNFIVMKEIMERL